MIFEDEKTYQIQILIVLVFKKKWKTISRRTFVTFNLDLTVKLVLIYYLQVKTKNNLTTLSSFYFLKHHKIIIIKL